MTELFCCLDTLLMGLQVTCNDDCKSLQGPFLQLFVPILSSFPFLHSVLHLYVMSYVDYFTVRWTELQQPFIQPVTKSIQILHSILLSISWCHLQTSSYCSFSNQAGPVQIIREVALILTPLVTSIHSQDFL